MKNCILLIVMVLPGLMQLSAQDGSPTDQGSWLIEANTNFGNGHAANTGFQLADIDDITIWNIGAEGGYFVMDDLAVKFGLGYGDSSESDGVFSFKAGAKYYINSIIPVQADLNGFTWEGIERITPLFVGIQGGYAWFLGEHVALEPGVRYDIDINDEAERWAGFSLNIGFSLYF